MAHAQILIIDNTPNAATRLKQQLNSLAYDVDTANSLEEALARLTAAAEADLPYELILIDGMMNGAPRAGSGPAIYTAIRRMRTYRFTPIIGGSLEAVFWSHVAHDPHFNAVPHVFREGSADAFWDIRTLKQGNLKSYLPMPRVMRAA